MTPVYLVTLVLDLEGVDAARAASAMLAADAVVTVRIAGAEAPSVVRLDVDAPDEAYAARAARELVIAVARELRCAVSIRSVHGVPDSERGEIAQTGHDHM